jgi:hypothetical protein
MEHLPLPRDPTLGSLDIPFLCFDEYDGGEFTTFPIRKAWTIQRRVGTVEFTRHGQVTTNPKEIGGFLQAWLYQGLLSQFLGQPVDLRLFQRAQEESHGPVQFTSKHLGDMVSARSVQVIEEEWSLYQSNLESWKDRLDACLLLARDVVLRLVHSLDGQPEDPLSLVCLSVAVLGEYLYQSLKDVFIKRGLPGPVRQTWRLVDWADCGMPLIVLMTRRGWCPNKLAAFDAEGLKSISKLWYFANIEPPGARESHSQCTAESCQLLQVDLHEYKASHLNAHCQCPLRGPDPELLANAVQKGLVPLVTLSADCPTKLNIELADETTKYVAISHVWADGNGNLEANSLTECHLDQIRTYLDALAGSESRTTLPFWMDTLCLPRHPVELRRKGIVAFNDVFRNASIVLVLDSYLQRLSSKSMSPTDLLARVSISGWTQRLWTFSEGRMGTNVRFQFQDRAVDLFQAVDQWRETFFRIPALASHEIDLATIGNFSAVRIMPGEFFEGRLLDLPTLRYALGTRSTSWDADEPICLAGILGLDIGRISQVEDSQRMKVLWSSLRKLPAGLAFSRASRKLTTEGYRWAPASLMGDLKVQRWGGPEPLFAKLDATPSEAGLIMQCPGVLWAARHGNDAKSVRTKQKFFECCLPQYNAADGFLYLQSGDGVWYSCDADSVWHQENSDVDGVNEVPAIILESAIIKGQSSARDDYRPADTLRGLLVTYPQADEGSEMIHAKAHAHVDFQVMGKKLQQFQNRIKACCSEVLHHNMDAIIASQDDRTGLRAKVDGWVEEYARRDGLLELGKEIWRQGRRDASDENLIRQIVSTVGYLCSVDEWYQVDEMSKPITWCID